MRQLQGSPPIFPRGSRGDMSTSIAVDAAVLDALYGDLPPYRPEPAGRTGIEGTVVTVASSLPIIPTSKVPSVMSGAELR